MCPPPQDRLTHPTKAGGTGHPEDTEETLHPEDIVEITRLEETGGISHLGNAGGTNCPSTQHHKKIPSFTMQAMKHDSTGEQLETKQQIATTVHRIVYDVCHSYLSSIAIQSTFDT